MPFCTKTEENLIMTTPSPSHLDRKKNEVCQNKAECSVKCRSKKDAAKLIAAVTRGTDQQSLAYIYTTGICTNPGKVVDEYGRTLLHIAASTGKRAVSQWLLKYQKRLWHSMAIAILNKSEEIVKNTTTASKYIPRRLRISIN